MSSLCHADKPKMTYNIKVICRDEWSKRRVHERQKTRVLNVVCCVVMLKYGSQFIPGVL